MHDSLTRCINTVTCVDQQLAHGSHRVGYNTCNNKREVHICSPFNFVDITHTNKLTEANEEQWQSGTVVVKHLQPILSRLLSEDNSTQETETTDHCYKQTRYAL